MENPVIQPVEFVPAGVQHLNGGINAIRDWFGEQKETFIKLTAGIAVGAIAVAGCARQSEVVTAGPVVSKSSEAVEQPAPDNFDTSGVLGVIEAAQQQEEDLQALKEALTVKTTDPELECATIVEKAGGKTVKRKDDTLVPAQSIGAFESVNPEDPAKRAWSDAIDTPFLADQSDKDALLNELQVEICENPLVGEMVANYFANLEVGGVKVVDLNEEWLKDSVGPAEDINDKAAQRTPYMGEDPLSLTDEQSAEQVDANLKYQQFALYLNTMLGRFNNQGKQDGGVTNMNFHLAGNGLAVGKGYPEMELNPNQYDASGELGVLKFDITSKGQDYCIKMFGVNLKDKRIDDFVCEVPEVPAPEVVPGQPNVPGRPSTPTTGGTGGPNPTTPEGYPTTTVWVGPKTATTIGQGGSPTTLGPTPEGPATTSTTAAPVTQPTYVPPVGSPTTLTPPGEG